jgi:hypothetical protein
MKSFLIFFLALVPHTSCFSQSSVYNIIGVTGLGKKAHGQNQHSLLNWLTHEKENKHFDMDLSGVGEMYLISEAETLYSVFGKGTNNSFLHDVIVKKFKE